MIPASPELHSSRQTLAGIIIISWMVSYLLLGTAPSVNKNIWVFQSSTSCLGELHLKGISLLCCTEYSVYICAWMVQGSIPLAFVCLFLINSFLVSSTQSNQVRQFESTGDRYSPTQTRNKGAVSVPWVCKLPASNGIKTTKNHWGKGGRVPQ